MILGRKKRDEQQQENAQRNKIVTYKRVFGTPEGKEVLFDLMNRYHVLNSHSGDALKEGQRSVVLGILENTSINLVEFDKLLKGESGE